MKAKKFIIGIIVTFIPFMFAINILRTKTTDNGMNNFLGTEQVLKYTSEIDFSFSTTYTQIALIGSKWKEAHGILDYLDAIYNALTLPLSITKDFFTGVWTCIEVFVKFVGFIPT